MNQQKAPLFEMGSPRMHSVNAGPAMIELSLSGYLTPEFQKLMSDSYATNNNRISLFTAPQSGISDDEVKLIISELHEIAQKLNPNENMTNKYIESDKTYSMLNVILTQIQIIKSKVV
jgi:hypothetical protein